MTYDIGNPGLGQTQQCGGGVKLKSRLGTDNNVREELNWLMGSNLVGLVYH
jgi:hypothetical protein